MQKHTKQILEDRALAHLITWATFALLLFMQYIERQELLFIVLFYIFGVVALALAALFLAFHIRRTTNWAQRGLNRCIDILGLASFVMALTLLLVEFLYIIAELVKSNYTWTYWLPTVFILLLLILLSISWGLAVRWSRKKVIAVSTLFIIVVAWLNWSTIYTWLVSMYQSLIFLAHYIQQYIIDFVGR
jgi:hypothetical protein